MKKENRFFPPQGASEADLLHFRDRLINRWSTYRNQHMGRIALAFWYYIGRQWAELDVDSAFDGVRGTILRDVDTSEIPRPVTNEISPAMEEEMIALVGRKWNITNVPTSSDPRIKAAAQVAKDQLNYRLEQIKWAQKRRQAALHFCVGGTGLLYTYWDKSYSTLTTIGAPSAVYCHTCNLKLYSDELPVETARAQPLRHLETAKEVETDESELMEGEQPERLIKLPYCPVCESPTPLSPYSPTEEEAQSDNDMFGRPMGVQTPRGGTAIDVDIPFEFFPQNGGARVTPTDLKRYGRRKIRSLEFVEERYPHLVDRIEPDSPSELLYDDPMLGEWAILGHWSPTLDAGILDNHVNLDEMVEEPSFRYPLGRYVVATKDIVLEDSNLLEEGVDEESGEKLYVPRVQMHISRYKIRPHEIWGTSGPDEVISPQNRLNGLDGQLVDSRLRMASPHFFMHPDMWVDNPVRMESGYSGKIFFFNPSIANPQFMKPEVFGGQMIPETVYLERDRIQSDMRRIIGPNDPTRGNAPKNVGTTSGIQLLIDQDERSRSLREEEFVSSAEGGFSHLLKLEWVLRVDPDVYRVLGPDKSWKYEQYRGAMLRGQYEIKVERSPYIGKSIVRREAAREALADRLIDPSSPLARRRLLEAYGIESDVTANEDQFNQVDQAERQWVDFVDKGIVRVQDSIDDAAIRYLVLSSRLSSEEGQRITQENEWDEVRRVIAGWEEELQRATMLEQQVIQFYGGRLPQQAAAEAYARAMVAYTQQMEVYEQQAALYPQLPPGVSPPPVAPTKPPPPVYLPPLLQDRILMVWTNLLQQSGVQLGEGVTEGMGIERGAYIRFRALVDAYRLTAVPLNPMMPPSMPEAPPAASAPANTSGGSATPPVGEVPPTGQLPEGGNA